MKNLDPSEFMKLWSNVSHVILEKYNLGPGRKSPHTAKNFLFVTLASLQHSGQWEFLARSFGLKGPTFERPITKFIIMLRQPLYQGLVAKNTERFPMDQMLEDKSYFNTF